ncbi:MAG: hypothetical protein P8X74_03860 [Reinekea sp.]
MKVWKCNECSDTCNGCIAVDLDDPKDNELKCLISRLGAKPVWRQTDKYELVKEEKDEVIKQTPNCAICRWKCQDDRPQEERVEFFRHFKCQAQGGKSTINVYNTSQCQQLFEPEDK